MNQNAPKGLKEVERDDYVSSFSEIRKSRFFERFNGKVRGNKSKKEKAFEFIIATRQFEIDLYWRRAAYFWTFISVTFAGYALLSSSKSSLQFEIFLILCIGLMLSIAWYFSNLGSKKWQENWENHLDNFEDEFMGPIYKTINIRTSFSVSKINECVSISFIVAWLLLILKHLIENYLPNLRHAATFDTLLVLLGLAIPVLFSSYLFYDRYFGSKPPRSFEMYKRKTPFSEYTE